MAPKKVMVAIDESQFSKKALEYYLECFHSSDDEIYLIHSIEIPQIHEWHMPGTVKPLLEKAQHQAERLGVNYREKLALQGLTASYLMEFTANAGQYVCEQATNKQIDMIVIGTRGMGSLRRTILGSVSDYVVHHAHCPVVVYRH